jgi:VCBS repeat-containing protein
MGGAGDDTYLYNPGDGVDRITDSEGNNTLALGEGLTAADLNAERQGDDLVLHMPIASDSVMLTDWFNQSGIDGVNAITFADGTSLDRAGMEELLNRSPVANPDRITALEDGGPVLFPASDLLANDTNPNPNDALSVTAVGASRIGAMVTLVDGQIRYDIGASFQSLAEGEVVQDSFNYTISDSRGATAQGTVQVDITGSNDLPVAASDTASTVEDALLPVSGNVLANDTDIDNGTVLAVANPSEYQGDYGVLTLGADGSYTYNLDNAGNAVQPLGREAVVAEHFGYTATDGIASVSSTLDLTIAGTNDAPTLVAPLSDQQVNFNKDFSWQLPQDSFADPDAGDSLGYGATLADGSLLPTWLSFDAATQTFSGRAPKQTGTVEVKVTATDKAASGSTEGSLSTSDVFQITISHGNEGVGNGEDAPPPGHDGNCNDGYGTSPGNPGRRRSGHEDNRKWDRSSDRDDDRSKIFSKEADDYGSWQQKREPSYLNASHWDDDKRGQMQTKSGAHADQSVMFGRWLTVDLAVSKALAEKKTISWLDERLGADTDMLGKESAGFLGATQSFGPDLVSLHCGQELKGFQGLTEGVRKVA